MKRKDLKPGTVFNYHYRYSPKDDVGHNSNMMFWVPVSGKQPPPGTIVSNDPQMDWEVRVISELADAPTDAIDPGHYKNLTPEPIDVTEGWGLNPNLASVVWYIARAGKKTPDPKEDLMKARRFLSREIARLEGRKAWD